MMRKTFSKSMAVDGAGALAVLALIFVPIAAWVTHIVATIKAGAYILLAIGALIAPVGVIHGVMIWFGVDWI